MKERNLVFHILALLTMIVWGLSYLSSEIAMREVPPSLLAFYRFLIAGGVLYLIKRWKFKKDKIIKGDMKYLILGGIFGVALYFSLQNFAVYYTSSLNVSVLIAITPVFTLLVQRIFFKEKLNVYKSSGVIISVFGIFLIVASKGKISLFSEGSIGDVMTICAVFSWIVYNIVIGKLKGTYSAITITAYQSLWGALFLSPTLLLDKPKMVSPLTIFNIIYLSIFCTIIAFVLYIRCLQRLGPTIITTYVNFQPVVGVIAACILLGQKINSLQFLGSACIIVSAFLVNKKVKEKNKVVVEQLQV
ncbi:drug/metabolite transporter (DMT)-like permease [Clostridium moniliforme]|uniref:Drug/metabolite transporter (DMT)-like permease n=1 Tax=Clostridium moniliforme TaxID=39489 RepID=A0ABS4EZF7_9CLOT|nr:DMT family transporter [Clostridium moniliforme]MBP1889371.1 drug/metabolite transporter (DMT)-like permease [Clostridium moniliforme]